MANMVDLIMRLEKRLIVLEMVLGITAEPVDLIHPKSLTQAQARIDALKANTEEIIK